MTGEVASSLPGWLEAIGTIAGWIVAVVVLIYQRTDRKEDALEQYKHEIDKKVADGLKPVIAEQERFSSYHKIHFGKTEDLTTLVRLVDQQLTDHKKEDALMFERTESMQKEIRDDIKEILKRLPVSGSH